MASGAVTIIEPSGGGLKAIKLAALENDGLVSKLVETPVTIFTIQYTAGALSNPAYLKLFDSASVNPGTTEPTIVIGPLTASSTNVIRLGDTGIVFSDGLCALASQAGGKDATSAPDATVDVILFTS